MAQAVVKEDDGCFGCLKEEEGEEEELSSSVEVTFPRAMKVAFRLVDVWGEDLERIRGGLGRRPMTGNGGGVELWPTPLPSPSW